MATSDVSASVGLRSERGPILISLMLTTSLVALDSTIVATAVPSIVGDLGGFSQFPWLFSVYLLAQAVSVPVYGKLADMFGRKPIMLFGIGLFLFGSILCGFAWSMPALIAFRAVQGLGAGAVQPMSVTIAGDIYTLAERAKAQGYLASVWAISAVVGPTLGGLFAQYLTWRWIFFVNIPLCALAAWMLIRRFHEPVDARRAPIDYLGQHQPHRRLHPADPRPARGRPGVGLELRHQHRRLAAGALLIVVFVVVQRRAAEPVLPLWVFTRRVLLASAVIALLVGAVLLGLTTYVPTFVQARAGHRAAGRRLRAGHIDHRLADLGGAVRPVLPAAGLSADGADRQRAGGDRWLCCALLACRRRPSGGRRVLLRGRAGDGPGRQPDADRRAEQRRLDRARRGHRQQPVLPVDRQRGRGRRVRRHREHHPGQSDRGRGGAAAGDRRCHPRRLRRRAGAGVRDGRGRVPAAGWPAVRRGGERGWPGPTRCAGRKTRRRAQPRPRSTMQNRLPSGSASTTKSGSSGKLSQSTGCAPSDSSRSASAVCSAAPVTCRSKCSRGCSCTGVSLRCRAISAPGAPSGGTNTVAQPPKPSLRT